VTYLVSSISMAPHASPMSGHRATACRPRRA
jgi:hypothetical protein